MSSQEKIVFKNAEILCRTASELGEETIDGLLDQFYSASSDPNVFRGGMRRARDCRELEQLQ